MDVTASNFDTAFASLVSRLRDADFVAIDTELSGLYAEDSRPGVLDRWTVRYEKCRHSVQKFAVLQFGICPTKWSVEKSAFLAHPFNFWVFPRENKLTSMIGLRRRFLVEADSFRFLSSHSFDFNKVVGEGISFVLPEQYEKIRLKLEEKLLEQVAKRSRALPVRCDDFRSGKDASFSKLLIDSENLIREWLDDSAAQERPLVLPPANSKERWVLHTFIESCFPALVADRGEISNGKASLNIAKFDVDLKRQQGEMQALQAFGFARAIQAVLDSKVPIVGHNCLLDLLHMIEHFVSPLPEDFFEFRRVVQTLIPVLFDTKTIARRPEFSSQIPDNSLGPLHEHLFNQKDLPTVRLADGFDQFQGKSFYHEAGYDAMMTGSVFAKLVASFARKQGESQTGPVLCDHPIVKRELQGLVATVGALEDANFNELGEVLSSVLDELVVVLSGFPSETSHSDVLEWVKPLGRVNLRWINDQSIAVICAKKSQVDAARSLLSSRMMFQTFVEFEKSLSV